MAKKQAPARRTPARGRTTEAEVLPAETQERAALVSSPDVVESQNLGAVITRWLGGMVEFFTTAKQLEEQALERLEASKRLVAPTNAEEDERIQEFIRDARKETTTVEKHWQIAQQIHALHRRLTTRRSVATTALETAQTTAQNLHNAYTDAERRRAAAEQERLRQEALAKAREDQERQAREAEERAMALEADAADLSDRETLFVDAYVLKFYSSAGDAVKAAARAGYRDPDRAAQQLLGRDKIRKAIEAKREAEALREQAQARRAAPVTYEAPRVQANISRAAGTYDRTTHNAEVLNLEALVAAWKAGEQGIPDDLFEVNAGKLKEYAESLKEKIELWPGVRYIKRTTTVGGRS